MTMPMTEPDFWVCTCGHYLVEHRSAPHPEGSTLKGRYQWCDAKPCSCQQFRPKPGQGI